MASASEALLSSQAAEGQLVLEWEEGEGGAHPAGQCATLAAISCRAGRKWIADPG